MNVELLEFYYISPLVNNRMYDKFKIIRTTDLDLQKNSWHSKSLTSQTKVEAHL